MDKTPDALTRKGLELFQAGRLDAAESAFRAALAEQADHPDALHLLGLVLHQKEPGAAEAVTLLERAAAVLPGLWGTFYHL